MKKILFRGKRKDNGEWVVGYYLSAAGMSFISMFAAREPVFVDCDTVGQFTGLTDKNGKDIFEGDIVAFCYGHNKDICTVAFENGAFGLGQHKRFDYEELETSVGNATGNESFFVGNDNFISLWEIAWNYNEYAGENLHLIEVIGNIHDNPELLEAVQ